jgi:hypothetical protein
MRLADGVDARQLRIRRFVREIARLEFAELWRELARPVILFDERSPVDFLPSQNRRILQEMVRPPRLERGTPGLEGRSSGSLKPDDSG